jgi:ribosomal protein S18 acetylase RimI-like enzyme
MPPDKLEIPVAIRPMRDSDLTMIRRGLSETNWQDIPEDQRRFLNRAETDKQIFDDFERYLKNERYKFRVFVAETRDGEPIGYVSIGELMNPAVGLRYGGILDFWVEPRRRGRRVGALLLDFALDEIRKAGYTHASILVSTSNEKAIRMYERRGFHPDRVTMVKLLEVHHGTS